MAAITTAERDFAALLERRFLPVLHAAAFAGEGWDLTRIRKPVINCVQIQPRSNHAACCVNLGIHFTFLPCAGGSSRVEFESILETDCEVRHRLAWEGEMEHWWNYDDGEDAASDLLACYERYGEAVFGQFANFPQPFCDITVDNLGGEAVAKMLPHMTKVRRILLLARIHDYLGNSEQVVQLCEFGDQVAGKAVGPKVAFKELLRKHK